MARMPIIYAAEPETPKGGLKPFLLLALTVAVLIFCGTLYMH
ncbi:MAG: hypothetical protein ACHP84_06060 [Caulobacterales bacterium]|jgi:hypothetical protein